MADVLRVISKFAPQKLLDVHLVETSSAMRELQMAKLQPCINQIGCNLHWHDTINDVPLSENFSMIIAHEFFDALPFHLLQKEQSGWQEVMIASNLDAIRDPRSNPDSVVVSQIETYPRLRRVLSSVPSAASAVLGLSSPRFQNLAAGSMIEVSPAAFKIARQIGELLTVDYIPNEPSQTKSGGGCGLIIDYGGDKVFGNSFRAFKNHKIVDVFYRPGECDLTGNVDFAFLREAMSDLVTTHGPISQSVFLESMGLRVRLSRLLQNANTEARRSAIQGAANRLVNRTGMGMQYQVMGITTAGRHESAKEVWPFVQTISAIS